MMNTEDDIQKVFFDNVQDDSDFDYNDECIAFHTDISKLPLSQNSSRIKMLAIVFCKEGKLQTEINSIQYTITKNQALVILPNYIINNCMLSPNYNGGILCMSPKGLLEQFSSSEPWNKVFALKENPIISIKQESLGILSLLADAIITKARMNHMPYYKEILISVVKAALYELMSNVASDKIAQQRHGVVKQHEVLFKRFITLLSQLAVKPRCLSWYANELCVTPKYLSAVSKRVSGKTAFTWINEYILVDIKFWLKNSDKSIKEVADLLNFPNISFFGKYCRHYLGTSPTELRRRLRNASADNHDKEE
ncbi:MAG: helix-turn-helix domain-containing protein [Muribaculaceae bacterium]